MRAALTALTDELKRLKSEGVKSIVVSEEHLQALRRVVLARSDALKKSSGAVGARPAAGPKTTPASTPLAASPSTSAPAHSPIVAAPLSPEAGETVSPAYETPAPVYKMKALLPDSSAAVPEPPLVKLPPGSKQDRWDALLSLVTNDPVCRAHVRPGKKVVLGVGSLDAKIFFCGEAPGAEEEDRGEPFVGPAGQLLTKMIQAMGLSREEVYIGNIMNWRPELPPSARGSQVGNRPPTPEELAYCLPYLRAQLEIVNPEVIVALGSTATQGLLGAGTFKTLGEIRSQWKLFAEKPVMITYHPSYILRNPSNRSKRAIWDDLLKVMERIALPISDKQKTFFLDK